MNCNRCGAPLKEVKVRKPVYLEHQKMTENGIETERVLVRYEEETDYADCPRCTGGY